MSRHHTLHAPAAGIRLVWLWGDTIVIDPGRDEHARTRHLARERYLLGAAVLASVAGLVVLQGTQPSDPPWAVAGALFLGAVGCAAIRSGRRAVPPGLVDLLEPLRTTVPAGAGEIHRLVWEAAGLIATTEVCDGRTACPDCANRIDQICARLLVLTRTHEVGEVPVARSGLSAPSACGTPVSPRPSRRAPDATRTAMPLHRAQATNV